MHAVIFDIDGTLLDSFDEDGGMYADAVRSVLGNVTIREAWGHYEDVSDTGILAGIALDNGLALSPAAARSIHNDFMSRLRRHVEANGPFREIPGARDFVLDMRRRPDVCVAYATGGWRASATLKLASAGFPLEGIPLATADDHHERPQIMRHALAQLPQPVMSTTYYGDGVWDEVATASLGWKFVPVGSKLRGITKFALLTDGREEARDVGDDGAYALMIKARNQ